MIVASLLVPDPEFAFKMPIAVCIRAQSTDKITVSEKLQVFGTEDFFYFIPQKHFGMWRKTSLVTIVGISSFILLMDLLLWYRFFIPADTSYGVYNPLIAVCGVFLAVIAILFLIRAKKQYSLKNSFPIRDDIVI
jgi:hypothetical protein